MQIFTDVNIQAIQTACNKFGLLQCMDGSCYPPPLKCNGVLDCRDGSDETNCNQTIITTINLVSVYNNKTLASLTLQTIPGITGRVNIDT